MKKLLAIFFLVPFWLSAQQDPLYNLYQFNQLMVNPAYAGHNNILSLSMHTRVQWLGIEGAPITNAISANTSFHKNRHGVGGWLAHDKFGINKNTEFYGSYAYHLQVSPKWKVSAGFQLGLTNFRQDYSQLVLEFDTDPLLTNQQENFTKSNVGTGFILSTDELFFGLSVPRMLDVRTEQGTFVSTRYKRHYYVSAGAVLMLSSFVKMKVSTLARIVDNQPFSADFSATAILGETVWLGAFARNFSTLGVNAQLDITETVRAGYAFEYPTSSLSANNFGSHELMIAIDLKPLTFQYYKRRYF
ncbi:MAG TPA: type IX secretion system membrane protein PorP/SprF [Cyclobacteriaceae bacterium]|nr:type IX secretion system membrane protein PorP/SprF [Cyclobacteriaceae bacterium]